jgi:hypothetical protein
MKLKRKITNVIIMKIVATLLLTLSVSYSSIGQITTDYDKSVDFSQYMTFNFAGWQEGTTDKLNQLDAKRILTALTKELNGRAILMDPSTPKMMMVLFLVLDDKTSTTAYTNYTGGMGYGMGRVGWGAGVGGMGMGQSTTTYSESDYTAGTFVIDFYDSESKKLIWQGILQKTVTENPKKREKKIPKAITKMMKNYPIKPVGK